MSPTISVGKHRFVVLYRSVHVEYPLEVSFGRGGVPAQWGLVSGASSRGVATVSGVPAE